MKIKALFFLQSNCGGAERMTVNIAKCLDASRYEVIFYIIGESFGAIESFIPLSNKYNLINIKSFKGFDLILKMIKVLYNEKPQFVFSSTFPINTRLCIASSIFPNIRVIIRSDNYLATQSFIQKVRLFISYRFLNYVIAQTEEMKIEHVTILKINKNKIFTFPNIIDTEMIESKLINSKSPYKNEFVNFVYVGRIVHDKGLDILFQSFSLLTNENPNVLLYIVGEINGYFREYYEKLRLLINKLSLNDKVIFVGFSDNPYVYIKYADCLVLPSRSEGLPNVVIESLFLNTPVAVTNCIPVIKRIVNENVNGCIAEVDDIIGFKQAMKYAATFGRVITTYTSASKDDFCKLFTLN